MNKSAGATLMYARHFLIFLLVTVLGYGTPCAVYAGPRQTLTADEVSAVLRHFVIQNGPWQPEQIEVVVRTWPLVSLPTGAVEVQVLKPRAGITPGVHSFLLGLVVAGKRIKTVWARAELRVFDEVMVTSRALAYAETITPADVRRERREVSALFTRPLTKVEEVTERQTARAIQVNQILTPAMVQQPQVIRPRSQVTLVYENVKLRIETPGQALEGGKVGDVIRVKNLSSGHVLEGEVVDARRVLVR